jgi:hypothetical protein
MARRSQIASRENPGFETMIVKTKSLIVGICLLAGATFGGQTVELFTKQSLGLDLATVPFGMTAGTNYAHADAPVSPPPLTGTNVSWTTNVASELYHRHFPNRILRLGFRNGRLETVRISISAFDGGNVVSAFGDGEKIFERRRDELRQIMGEIIKIRSSPESDSKRKGPGFDIRYGAACAPTPESLVLLEIEITPGKTVQSDGLFKTVIDTNSGQYVVVGSDRQTLILKDKFNKVIWSTNVVEFLKKSVFPEGTNGVGQSMEESIASVEILKGEIYVNVGRAFLTVNKHTGAPEYRGSD